MSLSPTIPSVRVVLVSILLLALLPMLGAVGLMLVSNAYVQQRAIETSLQVRARSLSGTVDARLEELAAKLEAIAPSEPFNLDQAEAIRAAAERRLTADTDWQAIALLDSQGRPVMLTGSLPAENLVVFSRQLRQASDTHPFDVLAATLPDGQPAAGIAVPLRQGTTVMAIALGIPHTTHLLPRLNRFDRSERALTSLVGSDGQLIATSRAAMLGLNWPDAPDRLASEATAGMVRKVQLEGRPAYVATARLHFAPWFVTYAVPAAVIEAPLRRSDRIFGGLALLITVPLTLVLLLGHYLAVQIRGLSKAADAVAHEQAIPAIRPSQLREVAAVQQALRRAAEMARDRSQTRDRLRTAELNLQRLQRLDTVGQLAAGVAHDFGNYLFTIRGNLELIRAATPENQSVQERLVPTLALAQEALQLVQQLSALARRRSSGVRQINVAEVLEEIGELLRHVAGRAIRLEFSIAPRLWNCMFDPLRLHSGLVNLVNNARHAMPDGGTIRIEARNLTLDPARAAAMNVLLPGRYVALSVSDTGIGMSRETAAHVFEPFFTTKPPGHGNGIGLSLLYGWVTAAGGYITVDSKPNSGTTFTILLPEHKLRDPNPDRRGEATRPVEADCQS